MPEAERQVVLLSSLRGLVRGLSCLFWGLPAALVLAVQTARGDWFKPVGLNVGLLPLILGVAPVLLAMLLLLYGVWMMGNFQKQERVWTSALERARFVAIINVGLAPFLFFWSKVSAHWFFNVAVGLLILSMLGFLYLLNTVLARLAAMLPDETLRGETRVFTRLNQIILLVLTTSAPFYFLVRGAETLPRILVDFMLLLDRIGDLMPLMSLLVFVLLPVAMTMALVWKTKEVIMTSVFSSAGADPSVDGR
jgi:hypothetical protein